MPKIIFKGMTREDDPIFSELDVRPENAKTLPIPKNTMKTAIFFAFPFMILCFICLYMKNSHMTQLAMNVYWIPTGIILGGLSCFIHEWLHAVAQPKKAIIYIGLIPSKGTFYMKSNMAISKIRFIIMSLLPILLGIIPLILFMYSTNQVLNALLWPMAMIGFVSLGPDYLKIYYVLKEVPHKAWIQEEENGLCWFMR